MTFKTIKNFTFDYNKKLGEGSTGTVYLGTDLRNNQSIAVKAIELKNMNNQVTQYLLKNEIRALKTTNHPNVLKAIDVIQEPDFVYIITDYLPGGTLAEYIDKLGKIPQIQSLNIFKQLVEGYQHIFDLHIYHRDLKPHNILFDSNFRPVLSDFGYCENTGFLPKPKLQYNVGSPGFMAPESIVGNLYSQNSQVWSLGAILYQMMTGKNYTNGKPVMQAVMLIKRQGPYYPENCSQLTKRIIKQCMMLRPQNRMKVKSLKQLLQDNIPNQIQAIPILNNQIVQNSNNTLVSIPLSNNGFSNFQQQSQQVFPTLQPAENNLQKIPLISGTTQTNVITLSRLPNQIGQESIQQHNNNLARFSLTDQNVYAPNTVHPSSMPNVHSTPQKQNIIRNFNPKKKTGRQSIVGNGTKNSTILLSISQPTPIQIQKHINQLPVASANNQGIMNSLQRNNNNLTIIQPHSCKSLNDTNVFQQPISAPFYMPDMNQHDGYNTMNANPFLIDNQNHIQTTRMEEEVQAIRPQPTVKIEQLHQLTLDAEKLKLQNQINQQMQLLQQQTLQQQALQQQIQQQNQLISMQQQALQQAQQLSIHQAARLSQISPGLINQLGSQITPLPILSQIPVQVPPQQIQQNGFQTTHIGSQIGSQLGSQINPQITNFQIPNQGSLLSSNNYQLNQQVNYGNNLQFPPQHYNYMLSSQGPQNQFMQQNNLQQPQIIPSQQLILPNGIYSQTTLNTSFQSNQSIKNNPTQSSPTMIYGPQQFMPQQFVPQQFNPQYQNVVGPNYINYYGS